MRKENSGKRYSTHEPAAVKPSITGINCPACHGRTVSRDVSSDDGWYVEYCIGGVILISQRDEHRQIIEGKFIRVPCEYWGAGFGKRKGN